MEKTGCKKSHETVPLRNTWDGWLSYCWRIYKVNDTHIYCSGIREMDDVLDSVLPAVSLRGDHGHVPLLVSLLFCSQGMVRFPFYFVLKVRTRYRYTFYKTRTVSLEWELKGLSLDILGGLFGRQFSWGVPFSVNLFWRKLKFKQFKIIKS